MKSLKFLAFLLSFIISHCLCMEGNSNRKRIREENNLNQASDSLKIIKFDANQTIDSLDSVDFSIKISSENLHNLSQELEKFDLMDVTNDSDNNCTTPKNISYSSESLPHYYRNNNNNNNNNNDNDNCYNNDSNKDKYDWDKISSEIGGSLSFSTYNQEVDYKKSLSHICDIEISLGENLTEYIKIGGGHFRRKPYKKTLRTPVLFPLLGEHDLTFDVSWNRVSTNNQGTETGFWEIYASLNTQTTLLNTIKQAINNYCKDFEPTDDQLQTLINRFSLLKKERKKLLKDYCNNSAVDNEHSSLASILSAYGYSKNNKTKWAESFQEKIDKLKFAQDDKNYEKLLNPQDKNEKRESGWIHRNIFKRQQKDNFPTQEELTEKINEYENAQELYVRVQEIDENRELAGSRTMSNYLILFCLLHKFLTSRHACNFNAITLKDVASLRNINNAALNDITAGLFFYINNLSKPFYKISTLFPWSSNDADLAAGTLASYYSNKVPLPKEIQENGAEEQGYAYQINLPYDENQIQFFVKFHSKQDNDKSTSNQKAITLQTCYPLLVFDNFKLSRDVNDKIQCQTSNKIVDKNEEITFTYCNGYEDPTKKPEIITKKYSKKDFCNLVAEQLEKLNTLQKVYAYGFSKNSQICNQVPREQKNMTLVEIFPLAFILVKYTGLITSSAE